MLTPFICGETCHVSRRANSVSNQQFACGVVSVKKVLTWNSLIGQYAVVLPTHTGTQRAALLVSTPVDDQVHFFLKLRALRDITLHSVNSLSKQLTSRSVSNRGSCAGNKWLLARFSMKEE